MAKYTYKQFIQAHKGKAMDYDGVAGCQCVDLTKYYLKEVFGLTPGAWGDAYYWYDGFDNIPTLNKNFTKIPNTPEFVPQKGDIVVWGKSLNGNWGHIAICSGEGDTTWFKSWENNWTGRNDPTEKIKHNYNHVSGFLRPKNQEPITGEKEETKVKNETKADSAPAQGSTKKVIDISQYQSSVDYKKLAKEVDGVIIRLGYRGWGSAGTLCKDSMLDKHLAGAKANKIPLGFYFFSQATTATEAKQEADYAASLIGDTKTTYPVYIDVEDSGAPANQGRADGLNKTQRTNIINAFCKEIEKKGFKGGVYASESWFGNKFDTSKLGDYSIWVAKYGTDSGTAESKPNIAKYDGWQFTSVYKLNSISSRVDMSYFYSIPTLKKEEINEETKTETKEEIKTEIKTETVPSQSAATSSTNTTTKKSIYTIGKVYTLQVDLKVRSGAGTSYTWKSRNSLTDNAKANSYNQSKAVLKKGTKVTVLEVKELNNGEIWGRIPSGWCLFKTSDGEYYVK